VAAPLIEIARTAKVGIELIERDLPIPAAVPVLDRCRIRTGTVREVHGETATVSCRPLVTSGNGALVPGPSRDETVAWSAGGRTLLAGLSPGTGWRCTGTGSATC
jgi:hypothetical protein